MPSKDVISSVAPAGPEGFDDEPKDDSAKPQPELLGEKVPGRGLKEIQFRRKTSPFNGTFHATLLTTQSQNIQVEEIGLATLDCSQPALFCLLGECLVYMNHFKYIGPINELPQCKVVQDLDKLMGSLTSKISTIYDMKEVLEAPDNPPPQQRYEL